MANWWGIGRSVHDEMNTLADNRFGGTLMQFDEELISTPVQALTVTNLITNDTALLGQALFWDPITSSSKDTACATGYHPNNAYTDGVDLPLGTNAVGYGVAF